MAYNPLEDDAPRQREVHLEVAYIH